MSTVQELAPKIRTKNKIRDAKIVKMYLDPTITRDAIAERFGISPTRVSMIVYKNSELIQFNENYEQLKRVRWLCQQFTKAGDTKKDPADLLAMLKEEISPKNNVTDNSKHMHLTVVQQPAEGKTNEANELDSPLACEPAESI